MNVQTFDNKCSGFADVTAHCCVVSMNNHLSCISNVLATKRGKLLRRNLFHHIQHRNQ